MNDCFSHTKPWIPGGEKSMFTVVIHWWRSPLRQFARARTIHEYDVMMLVSRVLVTLQINCGDVTILRQKRPSLATMTKWTIDDCFNEAVCSGHKIAYKKSNNTFVTLNNDILVTREVICQWFSFVTSSLVKLIAKSSHSWSKIVIHGNSCIILYFFHGNTFRNVVCNCPTVYLASSESTII